MSVPVHRPVYARNGLVIKRNKEDNTLIAKIR